MLSDEQWRNEERDERKREGVRASHKHARAKMLGRIVSRASTPEAKRETEISTYLKDRESIDCW